MFFLTKYSVCIDPYLIMYAEVVCLHRQNVVSYFAKFPSQIPNLSSLCWNTSIYQVACEAIQEAATNTSLTHGL